MFLRNAFVISKGCYLEKRSHAAGSEATISGPGVTYSRTQGILGTFPGHRSLWFATIIYGTSLVPCSVPIFAIGPPTSSICISRRGSPPPHTHFDDMHRNEVFE